MSDLHPTVREPGHKAAEKRRLREMRRHPVFDEARADLIVEALASGLDLKTACALPGFAPYWVVNLWRSEDAEFDQACTRAAEAYAEQLAAEVVSIADGREAGHEDRSTADRALSIAARQWAVKTLNRKKYDPAVKVQMTHGAVPVDEMSDDELLRLARVKVRPIAGSAAGAAVIDNDTGVVDGA